MSATALLLLVAWFGVPAIAERLTPLLPATAERKLGDAVDMQVRGMLNRSKAGAAFECGTATTEVAGRAALDKIVRRLEAAAGLPPPLRIQVVRRDETNAMALPGGQIYAADVYGAELMKKAGGDARAPTMLAKTGGATEPGMKILLDHPGTRARIAAINKVAGAGAPSSLLEAAEWPALKKICAES